MILELALIVAVVVITYVVLKAIISIAIFPGQFFAKVQDVSHFKPKEEALDLVFSKEITKENRLVHVVTITPAQPSGKLIIIFNGQNATFRDEKRLNIYCKLAKDSKATVIAFDYSGTGAKWISTWSYKPMVNDSLHVALQAAETGKYKKLILKGNSLGGALATKVVKRLQDSEITAYLWDGRSFKSTSDVAAGQIKTLHRSGHYENSTTKAMAAFAKPFAALGLAATQFEIEVAEDYKSIPSKYKNFYIVRSDNFQRLRKKDDLMMPYCVTLESDPAIKEEAKKIIQEGDSSDPKDLAYYRSRRKVTANSSYDAHAMPETKLFCRKNMDLTVDKLFLFFVTQYVENHEQEERAAISLAQ